MKPRRNRSCSAPHLTQETWRRGAIIVLTALLMIVLMTMLACSLDIGFMAHVRGEVQRAVDAGALAGAALLGEGPQAAEPVAREYVQYNPAGGSVIPDGSIDVQFGAWDEGSRTFNEGANPLTAIRVFAQQADRPFFFARVLGNDRFAVGAEAIATYQPRDIVVVLDYSASMNDDSELKHMWQMGRAAVEANLRQIYGELGSPVYGTMQFTPQYISSTNPQVLANQLGLAAVPYPYPSGSWPDYFRYVQNDSAVAAAGYARRYGYLTLVNYWLFSQPKYSETPDLWKTSEQPITAVKDALAVFLSYINESPTEDRVGLAVYTSRNGTGVLEKELTFDYGDLERISRQRQAGHYDYFTNIGAGMQKAREELRDNGRRNAVKLIVLMTDGIANRPQNQTTARNFVRQESQLAADANFPICTISLGASADTALMQEVADTTRGVHFNVPGGQSVAEYEEDLREAFRQIADFRPVMLVE